MAYEESGAEVGCRDCGAPLPKRTRSLRCRACRADRESMTPADRNRLKRYGIAPAQYRALLVVQGGRCAVCRRPRPRLVVDHCHVSGRVRGLLCDSCNGALGRLGDSAEALERAVAYLKRGPLEFLG